MGKFKDYLVKEEIENIYDNISELDDNEFEDFIDIFVMQDDSDEINEELSIQARKKKSHLMKRLSKKMQKRKKIKDSKMTSKEDLVKRSRKAAIGILKKKFSGGKTDLTISDKKKVEKKIAKMGHVVNKIAKKMFKTVKHNDRERKANLKAAKKETAKGINATEKTTQES